MRPLCDTHMMHYIECDQIDPYNIPGNVFGYNQLKFVTFACLPFYAHMLHLNAPTFEINGHEASVWHQYDGLHIMSTN